MRRPVVTSVLLAPLACLVFQIGVAAQASGTKSEAYAATFDAHWERLRDDYPYFELYGVDWKAEREEHRPRAIAAKTPTEFAWELARLICALPDPHVSFVPSLQTVKGKWSYPEIKVHMVERRPLVIDWQNAAKPQPPARYASDPHAYPEIIRIGDSPFGGVAEILAAGPLGSTLDMGLRWPDGSETSHRLRRPDVANVPPPKKHFGKRWLVTGRVGSIGYMRVRTFDPKKATLGPDDKMTTMLRAALAELGDTKGLILDLQGNGGGLVAASDPFLGNLLEKRLSYQWGRSNGRTRIIRPRRPRYEGRIVAIVDEGSASGGEWAARILRDAGRATVIGGRTAGAEAAVKTSTGPDGSVVRFSGWPMVEPGVTPFQHTGIEVDHAIPLTIKDMRAHGVDAAVTRVRRARFTKALELLGGPKDTLDAILELAVDSERTTGETRSDR